MTDTGAPTRVCLFTGASGVLGTDFCRKYGNEYAIVAIGHTRKPTGVPHSDWPRPGEQAKPGVYPLQVDLSDPAAARNVVRRALAAFNNLDLLVNAAVVTHLAPLTQDQNSLASFSWQLHMNVEVPARLVIEAWRQCWSSNSITNAARGRNVVNVSSTAGLQVYGVGHQTTYATCKAALNMLTYQLAREFAGRGVRVNAVAPTTFPSLIPTSQVNEAIVRLDAAVVTGRILVLDHDGTGWLDEAEPHAE